MYMMYDVENQEDFYPGYPGGALAVGGADVIRPNIKKLVEFADEIEIPMIASVDAHLENDPEFEVFPPHCIVGTDGQKKIPESISSSLNQLVVPFGETDFNWDIYDDQIIFEKRTYDVWNPELGAVGLPRLLEEVKPEAIIVYGVASNICVRAAVNGFLDRGYKVYVVKDAIKGLFIDENNNEEEAILQMVKNGALLVDTDMVII